MKKLGVVLCNCGSVIGNSVDLKKLEEKFKQSPLVQDVIIEELLCSPKGLNTLDSFLGTNRCFDGLVLGACSSRICEQEFKATAEKKGLSSALVEVVDLREQCSLVHNDRTKATEKASKLINAGIRRIDNSRPLEAKPSKLVKAALVIGGGIAGVQCSLDIASAGYKVYLVEREPSIGGVMSQLDKTIPTLDCSICIEGPRLSETGRDKEISIIPNAEVKSVDGQIGDFKVTVEVKPTYVDPVECNGCGACIDVCPVYQPNRYDMLLKPVKAIYSPFAQAVPLKYVIEKEVCTECGMCQKACDRSAIKLDDVPKTMELEVGAIVVATGAALFDPHLKPLYHYGEYENVITSMEFERIICASGPTGGSLLLRDRSHPKKVAFIQCVGSREASSGSEDCSLFCCAVSLKQIRLIKEHNPEVEIYVFYTDIRTQGKWWENLYIKAKEDGVHFIRYKPPEIKKGENGKLVIPYDDTLSGEKGNLEVDMVVLALGIRPSETTIKLSKILNVQTRGPGWIEEIQPKFRPLETSAEGVFIAGTSHGPRDISDSVIEGSGAAGLIMTLFNKQELSVSPYKAVVDTKKCTGCLRCRDVCEYDAITLNEGKALVRDNICKGCGACVPACFQGAVSLNGWEQKSLIKQIVGLLEVT